MTRKADIYAPLFCIERGFLIPKGNENIIDHIKNNLSLFFLRF